MYTVASACLNSLKALPKLVWKRVWIFLSFFFLLKVLVKDVSSLLPAFRKGDIQTVGSNNAFLLAKAVSSCCYCKLLTHWRRNFQCFVKLLFLDNKKQMNLAEIL